jgi:periplasmic protein CpxP/Spy
MSPFWSGALGAVTVLLAGGLLRRALWHRRFRSFGRGRGLLLGRLFRQLGTRPEQEQVVRAEADALAEAMFALRGEARALRAELADLLAAPALDRAAVEAALERRLAALSTPRTRTSEAIARIHAALDDRQRATLAAIVRHGPHRHCHGRAPAAA